MTASSDRVLAYHQRTKHHFQRYAPGPAGLDWDTQPDPFRSFAGAPLCELPLLGDAPLPTYTDLYRPGALSARTPGIPALAALLELAFGLSAWKRYGDTRWALRCNPSSGNLHPTEAYVVTSGWPGLADGVHHYLSRDHLLEQRCIFVDGIQPLPPGTFLLGLSSIHWREAWKYGERAYRYCQHDIGHALAAARYAAAALGWHVHLLADWSDADIAALLGIDRNADFGTAEREHPDLLLSVSLTEALHVAPEAPLAAAQAGHWQGRANRLSETHGFDWPMIDQVATACAKPRTAHQPWQPPPLPEPPPGTCTLGAAELIRQRRSAQAFDGISGIGTEAFYRLLDATLPRPGIPPWDAVTWEPRLHLLLFVHRVENLAPGLYLFLRRAGAEALMRASLSAEFAWERVNDAPAHLALYRMQGGDARAAARTLSCHQDIAADGAFSLAMLSEFERDLTQAPWCYRRLFWEAGMLGQTLYLEAEAAGLRGAGIGCFFDDPVHELIGIEGTALQSLYHFTIGGAHVDARLQTLPAYAHLTRIRASD